MKSLTILFLLITTLSAAYFDADIVEGKIDSSYNQSLSPLPDTSGPRSHPQSGPTG